jgi:hypothetical protein
VSIPEAQVQAAGWYDDPAGQARFRFWDGRHWTHQTTNATMPGSTAPALGAGFARLGDWLGRAMALVALAAVAVVVVIAWAADDLGAAPSGDADTVGLALLSTFAVYGIVSMTTGVVWVVWQYQLAESAPAPLRRGPAMQVLSWFIPVVSYWWPYQNMVDLWNAYGSGQDSTRSRAPSGIGTWWAALQGLPLAAGLGGGLLLATADSQDALSRLVVLYAGIFATMALSALLARGVVNRLSWRALEFCASVG